GTSNGRVYRSVNKGANWTVSSTGLAGRLDVKFRNSLIGFVIQSSDSSHVFAMRKTIDGGVSWTNYTIPANLQEGSFASVPKSPSTWINVSSFPPASAYSSDDGVTFNSLDSDNQYTAVGFYNEFIGWAGGFNLDSIHGGIYKWDRSSKLLTSVDNIIANGSGTGSALFVIQPNPARDYITVTSNDAISDDVKISFINSNGALLDHFTFKNNAGTFNRTIGLSNLSAGIYFVILQAGSKVETQKIIIQ
ncbi:MAG TPA: T9SS type A sorting domain-containing protein, partial [Bacteroidales bacterium]